MSTEVQRTRAASLLAISHLLAKDFAFRDAVATYDPDTVLSAALNFQERVKSDVVLVTDERGTVLALSGTSMELAEDLSTWPAVRSALTGEESVTTGVLGGRIYQTVSVPLRAGPDLLGTLSLGFEISDSTAEELKKATRSEISLVTRSGVAASSWTPEARAQLARALRDTPESPGTEAGLRTITINGEQYVSLIAPLQGGAGDLLGRYVIQRSLDEALGLLRSIQKAVVAIGATAVGVALVISFFIAKGITAPVEALVDATKAISEGNYRHRITVRSRDELGTLAECYNHMATSLEEGTRALNAACTSLQERTRELEATLEKLTLLEKIKTHLAKFVPESVKRIIESTPDAPALDRQERDVSVLFLDIAGYTRLSESLDLEGVNYLVERYFSSFLDDIYANNGDINETAGDGLMILFQDPDPVRHAISAVKTAIAIKEKTNAITPGLAGAYQSVVVNIGINSGIAAVGSTRLEGITGTRWTFTASGPVTNVAARIAKLATRGEILIGKETAARAGSVFPLKDVGTQELKNVSEPVTVYEVVVEPRRPVSAYSQEP